MTLSKELFVSYQTRNHYLGWSQSFDTVHSALPELRTDLIFSHFSLQIIWPGISRTISHCVEHSHAHVPTPQETFPALSGCPPWQQTLQGEQRWYKDTTNISSIVLIPAKNTKTMHQYRQNSSEERNHTTHTVTDKNIRKRKFWNGS